MQNLLPQALSIWKGLGRVQQIGLVAAIGAIVALGLIFSTVGRGPDMVEAFSGLTDEDTSAVVSKLKEAKIAYEIGERGSIRVPGALVNEVKVMMAGQGLGGKPSTGAGFELFNQPAFGVTEFAQKVNYQRALESELARSIGRMDAVESARVHLVIPSPTLFTAQQKEPTASVVLKFKMGKRLDASQVRSISSLVAGSVEGLKPEHLSIIDIYGNTLFQEEGTAGGAGLTSKQLEAQRGFESTTERDLQRMLDQVLGAGKATVRVSAQLDWDQVETTSETFSPPNAPPQAKTTRELKEIVGTGGTAANAGGAPGPVENDAAVPTYQASGTAGQGGSERTETQTTYELSKSTQKTVRAPGTLKRMNVSVMVDPTGLEQPQIDSIRNAVATAAGLDIRPAAEGGRGDALTVEALAFNKAELEQVQASIVETEQRDTILGYSRVAALVLGPLAMMGALWFILGRGPRRSVAQDAIAEELRAMAIEASASGPRTTPSGGGAAVAAEIAARSAGTSINKAVTRPIQDDPQKAYIREQIQLLGKTNPATVAQLIQTWMDEDRRN